MTGKGTVSAALGLLGVARYEFALFTWWQRIVEGRGYIFGSEYQNYVETVMMTKKPHPEARPLGAFKIG